MGSNLTKQTSLAAIKALDQLLPKSVTLIAGGGGAMILAHGFSLATSVDAVPKAIGPEEIDPFVKEVAKKLGLPGDWLNPYFSTFTHTLPADYGDRLIQVYQGPNLTVQALGREDLLIMKCYAGRDKDIAHARALIQNGADISFVEKHIETLKKKKIPGSSDALDFLDELTDT